MFCSCGLWNVAIDKRASRQRAALFVRTDLKQKPRQKRQNQTGRYKNTRFTASRYSQRIIHLFVKQRTRHATLLQHQTQQQSMCVYGLKSDALETRKPLRNPNSAGCYTYQYQYKHVQCKYMDKHITASEPDPALEAIWKFLSTLWTLICCQV